VEQVPSFFIAVIPARILRWMKTQLRNGEIERDNIPDVFFLDVDCKNITITFFILFFLGTAVSK
jgi:hypothetical protein